MKYHIWEMFYLYHYDCNLGSKQDRLLFTVIKGRQDV